MTGVIRKMKMTGMAWMTGLTGMSRITGAIAEVTEINT